ncbi:MAG TPA: hypothetical protein VHA11_12660 [Bryobacteraceae bacterium]|nr:hypothetical protein [Bryobacteraceae bacterium]
MTRYVPSRHYLYAGLAAVLLGTFSVWCAWTWTPALVASALFFPTALFLFVLWRQPAVEIHETYLAIGRRRIPWADIRALDRRGWPAFLILRITLVDRSRLVLIYPGELDSVNSLLRHLRRYAREALMDGQPYRGDATGSAPEARVLPSPNYHLLRPEDEAEVERLYQRLKTVRHLDPDNSGDEK